MEIRTPDSEYKYDIIKGFLNSNPDLGKCPVFKFCEIDMKLYFLVNLTITYHLT